MRHLKRDDEKKETIIATAQYNQQSSNDKFESGFLNNKKGRDKIKETTFNFN